MAFLKANWQFLVMGAVCLASIGAGVLALLGTSDVEARMKEIDSLTQKVSSYQRSPANSVTIEAKRQEVERRRLEFEASLNTALARQLNNPFYEEVDADGNLISPPRRPIMDNVLPEPLSAADAMTFRLAYQEEFKKLNSKLRARGGPAPEEILLEQQHVDRMKLAQEDESTKSPTPDAEPEGSRKQKLEEFLREHAQARAAEQVALRIYMYVEEGAFGPHSLVNRSDTPTAVEIWQAQMSLWIQQDLAAALAHCNQERAEELKKQGHHDLLWVAHMPVKHLKFVGIADQLGKTGGSTNQPAGWPSFTGAANDEKRFVVPIQLRLIVEEAAIMNVIGHICSIGFYTPTSISLKPVKPDPLYEEGFVYGEAPMVELTVNLEGYYFRAVFEQWIPKNLKQILKTPDCKDDEDERSGRG